MAREPNQTEARGIWDVTRPNQQRNAIYGENESFRSWKGFTLLKINFFFFNWSTEILTLSFFSNFCSEKKKSNFTPRDFKSLLMRSSIQFIEKVLMISKSFLFGTRSLEPYFFFRSLVRVLIDLSLVAQLPVCFSVLLWWECWVICHAASSSPHPVGAIYCERVESFVTLK